MTTDTSKDILQKFIFDNAAVRGELIEVSNAWREIQARHDYPKAVRDLLGEMVAAAALLSANLKFNGAIVMQIHGDGPVKLLVVECDASLRLRATAKLSEGYAIADDATPTQLLNQNGSGRFVITLDPQDKVPGQQPYQGVVPLVGDDIATIIENYMLRTLGKEEVDSAVAELGKLDINCDFCGKHYGFDAVDCAQLFAADTTADGLAPASSVKH